MFYLMTHSTHFVYGRKEMFYLTTHSTHFCLRKEGNVLFNDALNTFCLRKEGNVSFNDALNTFLFTEGRKCLIEQRTRHIFVYGRKDMFYLTTHSTHFCLRKEGMFYLTTHSTHFCLRKEGNVLFNDKLNTFYLRLYGVRHMVKNHSDWERGNPMPPHRLLFSISSEGEMFFSTHFVY